MTKYVLLVEDDVFVQKVYRIQFEKENIEIKAVSDGDEAIKMLNDKAEKPVVMILDLMLPHVSGFEVLKAVRENKNWQDVPVLVLSNLSQESDIEKAKTLGAKEYLVKADVKIDDVLQKVKSYLK